MRLLNLRGLVILATLVITTGCSITHPVMDDYGQYLANNGNPGQFQSVRTGEQYYLPAATQNHRYEFRSAMVGQANLWVVEFGKALDATMRSKDVIDAFGTMKKATVESQEISNTIVFDLQKYSFEEFGAHVVLKISVKNAKGEVFSKTYTSHGKTQGGKMFWSGAFGMKNAIQQSTKMAVDEIVDAFIKDVKAAPSGA
jgi:hypothetical protein